MQIRRVFLALLLPSSLLLSSCDGRLLSFSNDASLGGNWHLVGQNAFLGNPLQGPFLSLALDASGGTLYAEGDAFVPCSQGGGIGGSIGATAQIASDGTFVLTNSADPIDSIHFTITGSAPAPGATAWQGTYMLVNNSNTNCVFNLSGSFTATAYPPFDGTYAGAITGSGLGTGVSITLKVSQGAPTLEMAGGRTHFYIPLNSTIAVSGSPCFTTGTTASNWPSGVAGDNFNLYYTMNDGSTVEVLGWFNGQTETTLEPANVLVFNGTCASANGSGTFTLQP